MDYHVNIISCQFRAILMVFLALQKRVKTLHFFSFFGLQHMGINDFRTFEYLKF